MELKKQIKSSFKTEMLAAGLYQALSKQCGKQHPDIAARLLEAGNQEHMHGRLFRQLYQNIYGNTVAGERFWYNAGRLVAMLLQPVSMEVKLQKLCGKESEAVTRIEQELAGDKDPRFLKVLRRILPDEQSHAMIHDEFFLQAS